jgi:hypothetical protein
MKYIPLFILIQLISILVLFLPGVIFCGACILLKLYKLEPNPTPLHPYNDPNLYHWTPRWMWIWDNKEDGLSPVWYLKANPTRSLGWNFFIWTAFRNYANNWRFVPGVSKVGRPIFLRIFKWKGNIHHFEAGWLNDGYPTLNIGPGPW